MSTSIPKPQNAWTNGTGRGLINWFLYCFAALTAALEAISINSVFVGDRAMGALQAFAVAAVLLAVAVYALTPVASRHKFLARLITVFSVSAVLGLFVMKGKVNQLEMAGKSAAELAMAPTLVTLLVQLGLALFYLFHSRQNPPGPSKRPPTTPWWVWGPAVSFGPLFIVCGLVASTLLGWGGSGSSVESSRVQSVRNGSGEEKYSRFPRPADFEFAQETDRVGKDFGGQFIHYHTGQRPLLGIAFSNREWHRRLRVADDLRGIFDREAAVDGEHVFLAEPGYVVAGMQVQEDEKVLALRVRFSYLDELGLDEAKLNLSDSYWSDWAGGFDRSARVVELGSTGHMVLGITGTAGLVVNSFGLLIDGSAPQEALGPRGTAR